MKEVVEIGNKEEEKFLNEVYGVMWYFSKVNELWGNNTPVIQE